MPDQTTKPKGILRNRNEVSSPSLVGQSIETNSPSAPADAENPSIIGNTSQVEPFDRNAVLENTRANAKIHTIGNAIIQKHKSELVEELTANAAAAAASSDADKAEHLKWNEANLYLNEQEKSATMKITEPKTPFQGAVGDSEYYKPDEDEDNFNLDGGSHQGPAAPSLDDLEGDGLLLGEPEVAGPDPTLQTDRILVDEKAKAAAAAAEEAEKEHEETPEEHHRRFEQMRKNHYFMKGAVLHKPLEDLDDEDEDKN